MQHILHVGKFSDWQKGGIETAVDNLLKGLSPFFQLLNIAANNRFKAETKVRANYLEYSVPLVGLLARTPLCPTMPYCIKKLHQHYQFSMVHLHLPNPMAHFASEILPRSVKRVISWHSDVVQQKHLLWIYQPWVDRLLAQATTVIVPTAYLAENSTQLTIARQRHIIQVIPYGIEFESFLLNKHQKKVDFIRQRFNNCFIVFALGRHVYYKGFCYLIEAIAQLPANLVLLLGGKGSLTPALKQQVKNLKLDQRVYFLGEVGEEDLPAYYHACDVFCLPSIDQSEAFGIVQLEAMACAKPVICCNLAHVGSSSINQDGVTGFVVPPRSPVLLAKAIERLYREPHLCKMFGQAAYCYAKERFSSQLMIQRIKLLYESVLAEGLDTNE
jgi:glycosyltransferase involved in cell wall biosynthesis